jgi:release factor glutamine methyltransferase
LSLESKSPDISTPASPHQRFSTVGQAITWATLTLTNLDIPSARLDAEVLLADVLGWNRARLYARPEYVLRESGRQAFQVSIQRRSSREPVAYIVGHREFYGLGFAVDPRVLIPRPETELLVERAIKAIRVFEVQTDKLQLVDIGTGSGAVAVSLAVNLSGANVYAIDASRGAMEVAELNAARHQVSSRVQLLLGDLCGPLPERVHVIVANLPYIPSGQLASLMPEVVEHEPLAALDGGADGLTYIRRLLEEAAPWLLPSGVILLEIGADQGRRVVNLAAQFYPQARVELFQDYGGLDRVVQVNT